jgi:predicted dehydrogenase
MPYSSLILQFRRRLRLGMVGGGSDSVIGRTHLVAGRADGFYELVAGALSIDPEIAQSSARAELINEDRIYTDYQVMAEREAARPDKIDVVTIATPPQLHLPVAREFLTKGIHVICEKPFTKDLAEAHELRSIVLKSGGLLCLTHCYTGYPMVRQAKALISDGAIGAVRLIEAELSAGDRGVITEPADPNKRHWRFRKSSMGESAILGEVGSHPFNLTCFVTGLKALRVSARMTTIAAKREVYDNAYLTFDFENGAQGRLWASYVAAGNDHGLWFRIFGERGSLTWHQEQPNELWLKPIGGPATRYAPGYDSLAPESLKASRFRPGHPEGYALAFANLYSEFAQAIIARELSQKFSPFLDCLPNADDGVHVMEMIEAADRSNNQNGAWIQLGDR